jgi:NAD(P)-dependent dehydrogenase (short-subunit alcohol dehydrogenase family)
MLRAHTFHSNNAWCDYIPRILQWEKENFMQDKPVALVTGANQRIGLQIAKDLVAHGFTVLVGSRNFERGEAATKVVGPDAHALYLDVTDQPSITAAAERIRKEFGRLDVLVNNAAISNTSKLPGQSVEDYSRLNRASTRIAGRGAKDLRDECLRHPCCVSGDAAIATRGAGSPNRQRVEWCWFAGQGSGPGLPSRHIFSPGYSASKTAMNAMTLSMAIELESTNIKVNACSPGFIKTNLIAYEGTGTVEAGALEPVRLALLGPNGPTDTFTRWEGETIPW